MKIVGIGDKMISAAEIRAGFQNMVKAGYELFVLDWETESVEQLQHINLLIEQGGPDAYRPPEAVFESVRDADIIVTQFCPIGRAMMEQCPQLKAIGVLRAGTENIDTRCAKERGIAVFNTPGRNANAVADFTVGMLLAECRNIARAHANLKQGHWIKEYSNRGAVPDLAGKTAGIIGYGNIGRKVARRLRAFDMNLLAYDPYLDPAQCDVPLTDLDTLFSESDFVLVHYRLTPETKGMISRRLIKRMKPTAYFINTARSGLVDEDALADALNEHRIAGAAVDVFEEEPPSSLYKLVTPDNITVTPHLAGSTKDAFSGSPFLLSARMLDGLSNE